MESWSDEPVDEGLFPRCRMDTEDVIGQIVAREKVLGGVTAQGSAIVGPGVIRNAGNLPSHIGELDGGISVRGEGIAGVQEWVKTAVDSKRPSRSFSRSTPVPTGGALSS